MTTNTSKNFVGNGLLTLGIVLGVLTFWLFAQTLLIAGPAIKESIGLTDAELNLATSVTALASGCFIVVAGGLADKFGRVKFTYLGFILSIIGSIMLLVSTGPIMFTLGRFIQGISAACIMPATLALMKTYYEGNARRTALSWWSVGSWGGSGICSLAGGMMITYLGNWESIFITSIVCAVLGILLIKMTGIPESKSTEEAKAFDYTGLVLFVVALFSLNIFITKGASLGWTSPTVLISAVVFIVSLVLFIPIEKKKEDAAFIDFSLFKNMPYSGASFSNFMLIAVLAMIPMGQIILQKLGAKKPMLLGTFVTGIGVALMALTFLPQLPYIIAVIAGFLLFGLGLGFYATPSTDTAISNAPEEKVGVASGIYKMASSLGGAFGVAISATVYTAILGAEPTVSDMNLAGLVGLLVNVLFCVLSFISIVWLVPKNTNK